MKLFFAAHQTHFIHTAPYGWVYSNKQNASSSYIYVPVLITYALCNMHISDAPGLMSPFRVVANYVQERFLVHAVNNIVCASPNIIPELQFLWLLLVSASIRWAMSIEVFYMGVLLLLGVVGN